MTQPRRRPFALFALTAALLVGSPVASLADGEVNVYSSRQENLIKPLLDRFTSETGIKVNLVTGKDDALLQRLQSEGRNSPADLLMTADAGRLHRAKAAGSTQAVRSDVLTSAIPAAYRDPDGHWFGLTMRARPILYVKGAIDPATLSTYEALAEPAMKGKVCIRSSDNIYNQSMVAAMLATNGEAATEAWAKGLVANMARPPKGGDRDQIKAAAAGECVVAVANTYYLASMQTSKDSGDRSAAEAIGVFWPNQKDRGVHVNASGAAVTASAKNKDAAVKLLEFLVSPTSQAWYAETNGEYPVVPGIAISPILAAWGDFKADTLNLDQLGARNADAVRLMDRAGWR